MREHEGTTKTSKVSRVLTRAVIGRAKPSADDHRAENGVSNQKISPQTLTIGNCSVILCMVGQSFTGCVWLKVKSRPRFMRLPTKMQSSHYVERRLHGVVEDKVTGIKVHLSVILAVA